MGRFVALLLLPLLALAVPSAGFAQEGRGRVLFIEGCSSCHGLEGQGVAGVGPSLEGVGAQAADFYLSTGRMPLDVETGEQPLRGRPAYSRAEMDALVAFVASLGGPPVPEVDPARGNLQEGFRAYTLSCAGCHQVVGEGGVVTGAIPPPLAEATPTQIAEAVRIGPYLMPAFDEQAIADQTLDSIIRYLELTKDPVDEGGWGLGHIGPIPEGMVSWLLILALLILVARFLGERTR
jgi:ubiquinol-cytochrome c reductase cytochrome c subunit